MRHAYAIPHPPSPNQVLETSEPLRFYRGISHSLHFIRRAQERGLREDVLEFILTYGTEFHCTGALHLTVLERSLPSAVRNCPMASKSRDWIVLYGDGERSMTCYRRKNAVKYLRKKAKTRLSEAQLEQRGKKTFTTAKHGGPR